VREDGDDQRVRAVRDEPDHGVGSCARAVGGAGSVGSPIGVLRGRRVVGHVAPPARVPLMRVSPATLAETAGAGPDGTPPEPPCHTIKPCVLPPWLPAPPPAMNSHRTSGRCLCPVLCQAGRAA